MSGHKIYRIFTLIAIILSFCMNNMLGQSENSDKEIIIIEKVVDEQGNVISKNTKRYNGKYSEEDIQELLEGEQLPSVRSYDLDGLGFGDELQKYFGRQSQRPTIGVNLNFEEGQATVEKVTRGSGAEAADVREGDLLLSINGMAVSSIDDIYTVLDQKAKGDKVQIVVFRDGEELEKEVELGLSRNGGFFFEFPDGGSLRLFGDDESGFFPMDIDSLFRGFGDMEGLDLFDENSPLGLRDEENKRDKIGQRPTLGVFIDESSNELRVSEIVKDSPAERAGLNANDIILRFDDNVVKSFRELSALMQTKKIGDVATLEIDRGGEIFKKEVELE